MENKKPLDRIVVDPKVMVGKPVIRGTRLTVQYVLGILAQVTPIDEFLQEDEGITIEDILAWFLFAKETLENTSFARLKVESD